MSGEEPNKNQQQPSNPVSLRSSTLQTLVRQGGAAPKTGAFLPRAGGVTPTPKARPKLKSTFSFSPNVAKLAQAKPKPKVASSASSHGESGISVQNLLAHQLAIQSSGAPIQARRPPPQISKIVSASLQSKMAQYESARKKRRDANKSREILELSWPPPDQGEDVTLYTPISLPYVIRDTMDDEIPAGAAKSTDGVARKSQRPTIKNVDEANRNAAKLFTIDENESDLTDWCLVQLPSLLPALNKDAMERQKEEAELELLNPEERTERLAEKSTEKKTSTGTHSTAGLQSRSLEEKYMPSYFAGLPEGRLGTIQIRQSGKAHFVMGEHIFDVNLGSECNFAQVPI
eukprot:Blabericola_migrator_1__13001@NODE_868_length_6212_cov_72_802929_g614_i0_p3_GENE_NODE_868_length_6212_cov_72_802929_g614_i0NODE_868_length_6212_cov_72_802929_g614_i0_p3_ORF_typecomplete_len345_score53_92RNA_pol_Rpc4/PF05132_14/8_3e03RNA_pol_Rpc4/PF05132_14/7_3e03RNA_pol_Rpc4/PF05132_14/8_9e03RNA_pol_Rpc4/PF05132_14/5_7e16_NODE_868_length_6212_cov_72_802929_g614_i035304564